MELITLNESNINPYHLFLMYIVGQGGEIEADANHFLNADIEGKGISIKVEDDGMIIFKAEKEEND